MSAQPRQSPSCSPTAQSLQMGAGGGAVACAGSVAPGRSPIARRCLVSQPWHQPPVTLPHQSHGPAPSKPECCRAAAPPLSVVPRCIPQRPLKGGGRSAGDQRTTTAAREGRREGRGGAGRERAATPGLRARLAAAADDVSQARHERSWTVSGAALGPQGKVRCGGPLRQWAGRCHHAVRPETSAPPLP